MNWLSRLIISSIDNYLNSLGASPDIIYWIKNNPQSQWYADRFRENPNLTLSELQQMSPRNKKGPTEREFAIVRRYKEEFKKWALWQLRKLRSKPINSGEDYEYKIPINDLSRNLGLIYDWWDHSAAPVMISSYSWDHAMQMQDAWHKASASKGEGLVYGPLDNKNIVYSPPEWGGWSIQAVTNENDLLAEGNLMDHCVGDYCERVELGKVQVYSLRDPANRPHVTIGIDPLTNEVFEVQGKGNTDPNEKYAKYITDWFAELKNSRPGLYMGGTHFDFRELSRVDNVDLDDKIMEIVYGGPESYGLSPPIVDLDIEVLYNSVLDELNPAYTRNEDTWNAGAAGRAIADVAWDATRQRYNYIMSTYDGMSIEDKMNIYQRHSSAFGVGWLFSELEKNNSKLYENFHYIPYLNPDEFESEEEYEDAVSQEEIEYIDEFRRNSLPYALDDAIADRLVELERNEPFVKNQEEVFS